MKVGRPTVLVACNQGVSSDVGLSILKWGMSWATRISCVDIWILFFSHYILRKSFVFSLLNICNLRNIFVEEAVEVEGLTQGNWVIGCSFSNVVGVSWAYLTSYQEYEPYSSSAECQTFPAYFLPLWCPEELLVTNTKKYFLYSFPKRWQLRIFYIFQEKRSCGLAVHYNFSWEEGVKIILC